MSQHGGPSTIVSNFPAALRPIIQQGFQALRFEQGLRSKVEFRAAADRTRVAIATQAVPATGTVFVLAGGTDGSAVTDVMLIGDSSLRSRMYALSSSDVSLLGLCDATGAPL